MTKKVKIVIALLGGIAITLTFFLKKRFTSFRFFPPSRLAQEVIINTKIRKLTLEEKVGALFMVGFNGISLDEETEKFISDNHFIHFLLLGKNIESEEQLMVLTSALCQGPALTSDDLTGGNVKAGPLHCIVAVDQEGGLVSRIGFGEMDNTAQAEIQTVPQAYKIAKNRGESLKKLGINMNLAPIVEVVRDENSYLSNLNRAFIGDEEFVFELSEAMIKGFEEVGIIPVPKHFPGGLGRLAADPHQTLPVVDIDRQQLDQDLLPLKRLIETGQVRAVMSTHILYPKIDQENIVTTSKEFIDVILRQDLGFEGAVISDDLVMRASSSQKPLMETVKQSFLAGHDILILSGDSQTQDQAYEAIIEAVRSGEIQEKRVEESLKRLLRISTGL